MTNSYKPIKLRLLKVFNFEFYKVKLCIGICLKSDRSGYVRLLSNNWFILGIVIDIF